MVSLLQQQESKNNWKPWHTDKKYSNFYLALSKINREQRVRDTRRIYVSCIPRNIFWQEEARQSARQVAAKETGSKRRRFLLLRFWPSNLKEPIGKELFTAILCQRF
jgi:hypothetical protein